MTAVSVALLQIGLRRPPGSPVKGVPHLEVIAALVLPAVVARVAGMFLVVIGTLKHS